MSRANEKIVASFYLDIWELCDRGVADEILSADLRFRGSLGFEKHGVDEFWEYVEFIHKALGDYKCTTVDLVHAEDRVAARVIFKGMHIGEFFGFAPTGKAIEWSGGAFFTIIEDQITDLWVLGDIDAIKDQLSRQARSL